MNRASRPDCRTGYTIGMGTSSTLALIAQGKATDSPTAHFTHIARVSTDPLMLLVPSTGTSEIARRLHHQT